MKVSERERLRDSGPMPAAREVLGNDTADSAVSAGGEIAFFAGLRLCNGTYKLTFDDRLTDLDERLVHLVGDHDSVRILDIGVSSGTTTMDLADRFEKNGTPAKITATDFVVDGTLRLFPGELDLLVDSHGHVLQVAWAGWVKGRPHEPWGSPRRALLQIGFVALETCLRVLGWLGRKTPVQILSPRVRARDDITVFEHDVTTYHAAWRGQFDIIRAANILNRGYFDDRTLRDACGHLIQYVSPGGIIALCRTLDDGTNHATVFRVTGDSRLEVVERLGSGSEVEPILRPDFIDSREAVRKG